MTAHDTDHETARTELVASDIRHLIHGYTNLSQHRSQGPRIFTRGEGIYVIDAQGRRYIEAAAGMWCASLGFSEEALVEAAVRQFRELPYYHTLASQSVVPSIRLAEKLSGMVPIPDSHVYLTLSGSEANDFLIKFLWYYNNAIGRPAKKKVISRVNGYHGATIIASSLSGIARNHVGFDAPLPGFLHTWDPHYTRHRLRGESETEFVERILGDLEQMIVKEGPDTVMAFMAEPVTAGGGVVIPPAGYYTKLQALLSKYEILFLADEIVTGFGRTGNMFGCETFGIRPAAMTMGKALSAAYQPIAAIALRGDIYEAIAAAGERWGSFGHGNTHSGTPVGAAVALRTLELMEERQILAHVRRVSAAFLRGLKRLDENPLVDETRGIGLIAAVQLRPAKADAAAVKAFAEEAGVIVRVVPAGNSVALSPPLIISEAEVDDLFDRLGAALKRAATLK
ncbi:MAG TPA: aminotransferase [Steroidobacteraceae bacterium]|jgi:4-aminobutyrate--pyruvate transaminase|nr:aminotransferase [Steroidobacteraceae bacterium]